MNTCKLPLITFLLFGQMLLPATAIAQLEGMGSCAKPAPFVLKQGLSPQKIGWNTADRYVMGIYCFEVPMHQDSPIVKRYQHPSWQSAGFLGPMVIDESGNVYVAPAPKINNLYNDPVKQNIIYKIDAQTGEMKPLIDLPRGGAISDQNPYGIMGLAYDCEAGILYVTSVSGSDRDHVRGRIFSLRNIQNSPAIVDTLENVDAFGITVARINGGQRIIWGDTRSSDVYSCKTDKSGHFIGETKLEFSIDGYGPRGDDRVRKIKISNDGKLTLWGMSFYFNLTASGEKKDTMYTFRFNPDNMMWTLESVR